jgi:hypothetical protein
VLRQLARWCRDHDTTVSDIRRVERSAASTTPNQIADDKSGDNDETDASEKADAHG